MGCTGSNHKNSNINPPVPQRTIETHNSSNNNLMPAFKPQQNQSEIKIPTTNYLSRDNIDDKEGAPGIASLLISTTNNPNSKIRQ